MEKFFKLKENGTNVRTEFIAGLTTFVTMAYVIFVNPIPWKLREWTKVLCLLQQYLQQ